MSSKPGFCSGRQCKAGWTCACGGRTHLCAVETKSVNVLEDPQERGKNEARCTMQPRNLVDNQVLELGRFNIKIAKSGFLTGDCMQLAVWHQGDLLYSFPKEPVNAGNVDRLMRDRSLHRLHELQSGDVIGFRWKEARKSCFMNSVELVVNGVAMATQGSSDVSMMYSNGYSPDWFSPSFVPPTPAPGAKPKVQDYLPVDWDENKDSWDSDEVISNYYFRVVIP
eukprot:Plantae.Rhodophyta-Hildenbrandia_rubra.ctg2720.p1 GENE.Plantae.Rhodophyta-Hildenbrandia_rubra.ctg2720~~Plantae.Rhodophyta-Hildenbrandia_rubra.ctg2720.p1  ORF type:complete len:224 (+),score=10.75 Plantae.Rhodophyta-Hildenbrandia_rubra.ctg2720:882-1553(+)